MKTITVTVVYALPNSQYIYTVKIKEKSTVKDAILSSNILNNITNIKLYTHKVGIYNKLVHLTDEIKSGDRIEIYRNLIIDPKERRRKKYSFIQEI